VPDWEGQPSRDPNRKPGLAIEIEGIFALRTEFHSFRHTS
jgi:hypothetical protein